MNDWKLIASNSRCFTIAGRTQPIDKSNFNAAIQLETLNSFKNMLYDDIQHDFTTGKIKNKLLTK